MGKKILVLAGSPRKGGNSDLLCDSFIRGAREAGHKVEKKVLSDCHLQYCTGCGVCNETHACILRDDMAAILDSMLGADSIVMASPVYFYTISAQMKTLIDRVVPRYTELAHKDFYFIVTAADGERAHLERAVECFRGFTDCLDDPHEKGVIYGTGVWKKGEVLGSSAMEQAYHMGLEA